MRIRHAKLFLMLGVLLMFAASAGVALGKAHVPVGDIQVAHRGVVKQLPEQALDGHLRHGDIQLPACDFNNVFLNKGDASNVLAADFTGVLYSDIGFVPRADAGGVTPACPPGTF